MHDILTFIKTHHVMLYLAMPFISGFIGYITNVIAIKMMFYPENPIGIKPYLTWQGIIPSKISFMASITVDIITSKLISVKEAFGRLDPKIFAKEMESTLESFIEPMVHELMESYSPRIWETLPAKAKNYVYKMSIKDIRSVVEKIVIDVQEDIENLFDLKKLVIDALVKNKKIMNDLFLRCGKAEFKFIADSGFYFGFIFGIFQMVLWIYYKPWWLLPVAGITVGYLTNWLALKMVFKPVKPKKIGPYVLQGLFLKRQKEVSQEYGELVSREIINPKNIINAIINGPTSDELFRIIQIHTKASIDKNAGLSKHFVQFAVGTEKYIEIKNNACSKMMTNLPNSLKSVEKYVEDTMDVQHQLTNKMIELDAEDFMGILRPAFQQDEWKLIAAGGVLGFLVGLGQLFFMFGGPAG